MTNSNLNAVNLIAKDSLDKPVRNTFGILDKETGKPYLDILHSSRHIKRLSYNDLVKLVIYEPKSNGEPFRILADYKLIEAFRTKNVLPVIISFQVRTNGNFAVCRLFKQWKDNIK